jgi:hypothetical protein
MPGPPALLLALLPAGLHRRAASKPDLWPRHDTVEQAAGPDGGPVTLSGADEPRMGRWTGRSVGCTGDPEVHARMVYRLTDQAFFITVSASSNRPTRSRRITPAASGSSGWNPIPAPSGGLWSCDQSS